MIIWSGFGILIVLIIAGCAALTNLAIDARWGHGYYDSHQWTVGVAMLAAALACWLLGRFLKNQHSHRLFFIPVHFWPVILTVIAIVLLAKEWVK